MVCLVFCLSRNIHVFYQTIPKQNKRNPTVCSVPKMAISIPSFFCSWSRIFTTLTFKASKVAKVSSWKKLAARSFCGARFLRHLKTTSLKTVWTVGKKTRLKLLFCSFTVRSLKKKTCYFHLRTLWKKTFFLSHAHDQIRHPAPASSAWALAAECANMPMVCW